MHFWSRPANVLCAILVSLMACGEPCRPITSQTAKSGRAKLAQNIDNAAGTYAYCIVTHYTDSPYPYAAIAVESQARYAHRHGFRHVVFKGHISGKQFTDPTQRDSHGILGAGLYWQKIAAVQKLLQERAADGINAACAWVMWMDSDAVFTNETILLDDIVNAAMLHSELGTQLDVLLSREDAVPVNAGVFLIHNTFFGQAFMDAVASRYPTFKNEPLPEQSAMAQVAFTPLQPTKSDDVTDSYLKIGEHIVVAPQRAFNSFFIPGRQFSAAAQWRPCDFIAHLAGSQQHVREQAMRDLLATRAICEERASNNEDTSAVPAQ